jgi:hypothetical protein
MCSGWLLRDRNPLTVSHLVEDRTGGIAFTDLIAGQHARETLEVRETAHSFYELTARDHQAAIVTDECNFLDRRDQRGG